MSVALETVRMVAIRIPNETEWVGVARLAVAAVARRVPFSFEQIEDVKNAVSEACTNAVKHARSSEFIDIRCEVAGQTLRVIVADQGPGISAADVNPTATDALQEDGLGIFIMRSLMDSVEYETGRLDGTQVVLTKSVSQ